MRFSFNETDPKKVRDLIMNALGGRELGKMVQFELAPNTLEVSISKLGTSKLSFEQKPTNSGLEFSLISEKIAFAHRAFKDDVKKRLCSIIEQVGGKVSES